jgi:hypothetical protein
LHAGKLACQKKRARRLANWQASQLAPTLKPPNAAKITVIAMYWLVSFHVSVPRKKTFMTNVI